MTDTDPQGAAGGAQPRPEAQIPRVTMLAHFVRDLSFENVGVIQGHPAHGTPKIQVAVNLEANKFDDEGRYAVNMKITAKAEHEGRVRFLVELDYGGIFSIENAPAEHVHPILFIECPRQLLPFARRVIADVTRDGGYPPLLIDNMDFATLYRQKLEEFRREQASQGGGEPAAAAAADGGQTPQNGGNGPAQG